MENTLERYRREEQENRSVKFNEATILHVLCDYEPTQRGGRWWARCPLHADRRPSLSVNRSKEGHMVWYCHACNVGGDVFGLVMRMEGIGFREARARLCANSYQPTPMPEVKRGDFHLTCTMPGCKANEWALWSDIARALDTNDEFGSFRGGLLWQPSLESLAWVCFRCSFPM